MVKRATDVRSLLQTISMLNRLWFDSKWRAKPWKAMRIWTNLACCDFCVFPQLKRDFSYQVLDSREAGRNFSATAWKNLSHGGRNLILKLNNYSLIYSLPDIATYCHVLQACVQYISPYPRIWFIPFKIAKFEDLLPV